MSPDPMGSPPSRMTIGMVEVACWAARIAAYPDATMTATSRCTKSAARAASRSCIPPA
jgi:hypothetical protein